MGLFFFYNNRKPRKFNYKPILFDAEEEERKARLEKRIRDIKREMNIEVEEDVSTKKTDFKEAFLVESKHLKKRKAREADGDKPFFTNNTSLVLIIIALLVLFYLLFLR